ncbi:DNA-3-methyladenine glycosylase [Bacillus shivajii]|uniref:DNA-3-methyladenine glycosylase family protein n=1 Tax=Bacillus shivajii TaxID=1983719 RepID=UPI001CF93BEC|nr:DNA-3-methyladenine glycosylase [Bacillus shivajii]UCZ54073.1 DNA-3-methyladenine glycosylase [Bacillus shivajii]
MDRLIQVSGPYNFNQALIRLALDPLHVIDRETQQIKVPIYLKGKPIVVTVTSVGTFEKPSFRIEVKEMVDEQEVIQRLNELFHWDIPLEKIYKFYQNTEIAPLFKQFRGTPFVCDFQLYGCLMKTIIHQQLNMTFAFRLTERFVKTFGEEKEGVWFYPSPEKVSQLTVEQLRDLQFSGRKAEYVIDTSKLIADGDLNLEELKKQPDEEVIRKLVKIRGIGKWTAENFLMFGLGRLDLFPAQDIGIQNAWKKFYNLEKKPTLEEMAHKSVKWKPYRTYASLYLWESIEAAD